MQTVVQTERYTLEKAGSLMNEKGDFIIYDLVKYD